MSDYLPERTVFLVLTLEQYVSMTSRMSASSLYVMGLRLERVGGAVPSARQGRRGGAGRRLRADQPRPKTLLLLLAVPPWRFVLTTVVRGDI